MILNDKNFWKAYIYTMLQVLSVFILSILAYLFIQGSMASVLPFLEVVDKIQSTGELNSAQFWENMPLFNNFIIYLISIVLLYILLFSGVLSFFDILISGKKIICKEWLFEWFRYSCIYLLLLILIYTLLINLENMLLLAILIIILFFISSYTITIMHLKLSLRSTILRALKLFLLYVVLFVIVILSLGLLKWIGVAISFLMLCLLLLWSKVYLSKKR